MPRRNSNRIGQISFATARCGGRCLCALLLSASLTGCISSQKYWETEGNATPPHMLNVDFTSEFPQAALNAVIIFHGPGSWKTEALWDEYVVTVRNTGADALVVSNAVIVDFAGIERPAHFNAWELEAESKRLCADYDRQGIAFAREAGTATLYVGGIAAGASAFASLATTSGATVTVMQGPLAVFTVPSYVAGRLVANYEDRADLEADFRLRCWPANARLVPGQTRTASFFFPMLPSPRTLRFHWRTSEREGTCELSLEFLRGLHAPTKEKARATTARASKEDFAETSR